MKKVLEFLKLNFTLVIKLISLGLVILFISKHLPGNNDRLNQDLIGKEQQLKLITEYAADLKIQYVKQSDLQLKLNKEWAAEKKYLTGRVKVLSNATFLIREKARDEKRSDITYTGTGTKFIVNEIRMGQDGPPIGYILIFDDGRVVSKVYDHEIDIKTAMSRDESSGKYDVLSKADYILKSPTLGLGEDWYNKPYALKIEGGTAVVDPTEANQSKHFYFWAPRLNGGVNVARDGLAPTLGVSTMGYGYSKRDLDLKLLQIGTQYSKDRGTGLTFTPVLFRPFSDALPNTYAGPGIAVDKLGIDYFMGVSVGF